MKLGALVFAIGLPTQFAINLQLLGGIWIIQTLPVLVVGLYTRWLHRRALAFGWLIGMVMGTWMEARLGFAGAVYPLHLFDAVVPTYIALATLVVNFAVAALSTVLFRMAGLAEGVDRTCGRRISNYAATGVSNSPRQCRLQA